MLRKICNYLAVIAFSTIIAGNSVLAHSSVADNSKNGAKAVVVENDKDFHLYKEFLSGGGKHSYTVKVEAGKEMKIKIRASNNVSLKIQTPDGQIKDNPAEKYFEVELGSEGEYVVELESLYVSQYSMEVLSK